MAYADRGQALPATVAIIAGILLVGLQAPSAFAQDMPPGVTVAAKGAFTPPQGLGAFQAMTFVLDIAPGAAFPLHSHPGRSEVLILQGVLTQHPADAPAKVYHAGDSFMEEPGAVHSVSNDGSEPVRLVWTLLLPEGAQPIEIHSNKAS